MNTETKLYKTVNALQKIDAGEHYYKSRHQADIARKVLDEINAEKGKAEQPAVPDLWQVEQRGDMYLIQKHDDLGCFLKGEWIEPERHGHIICEMLSAMARQGGRE